MTSPAARTTSLTTESYTGLTDPIDLTDPVHPTEPDDLANPVAEADAPSRQPLPGFLERELRAELEVPLRVRAAVRGRVDHAGVVVRVPRDADRRVRLAQVHHVEDV